jgi:hypothetical protein
MALRQIERNNQADMREGANSVEAVFSVLLSAQNAIKRFNFTILPSHDTQNPRELTNNQFRSACGCKIVGQGGRRRAWCASF